jgi:ubiquinone/menaquinone biosynthesis C-methylase UbiE
MGKRRPRRAGSPGSEASHGWEACAEWYDELVGKLGSEYHRQVVIPRTLRLLEVRPGERILDLACGQGVLCRALARTGAQVTGVDLARSLIEAAKRHAEADGSRIDYRVGDARNLGAVVPADYFDSATCVLAIQNIAPLSPVWEGCRRALKKGGKLVVVMMHPCFRIPRRSHWGWDERADLQYRRIDEYLSSSRSDLQIHPGTNPSETAAAFHRPLQAYVNTLGSAALWVDSIQEWTSHKTSPEGPRKRALDKSRKEIPMFLALRARSV